MTAYTQPALFPDTEVTGTGRPHPWPLPAPEAPDEAALVVQADQLPFTEEPQP